MNGVTALVQLTVRMRRRRRRKVVYRPGSEAQRRGWGKKGEDRNAVM